MMRALPALACGSLAAFLAWPTLALAQSVAPGHTPPGTDAEMITNALAAAPDAVARDASVIAFDEKGNARMLRRGTNNFTCIPDDPTNPANDPQCLDANGLEWAKAWIAHVPPPKDKVGIGYMLQGGTTPSNVDPFATQPPAGMEWMQEPPHLMVFNLPQPAPDYPRPGEHADMSKPWVMWAGSPYEHLMIPVR